MMRLLALTVLLVPLAGQAQITFERTYGGPDSDQGFSVDVTGDGGYVIAGSTESYGAGNWDVYLVKTDSLGNVVWARTYGGPSWDYGHSVVATSDGGCAVAGVTNSFGVEWPDVYLVKTDAQGDSVWARLYDGPAQHWDAGYSVAQTSDGGYIISGFTTVTAWPANDDVYLIKADSQGDIVWTRTYTYACDYGVSVDRTSDGGYVVAGSTCWVDWTFVYVVGTDSAGHWDWTFMGADSCYGGGESIVQTGDGGYVLAGWIGLYVSDESDVYIIKLDAAGDTIWTRTYGGTDVDCGQSIRESSDGGYVIAGFTGSYGAGSGDVWLIRLDSAGDTVWTRTFGGSQSDRGGCVVETEDGGFIIAGSTSSFGAGSEDVYLIKTDAEGLVHVTDRDDEEPRPPLHCLAQSYPNPFRTTTCIRFALPDPQRVRLAIYDIRGAHVRDLVDGTYPAGPHQITWDGRDARGHNVASGIYFYRFDAGDHSETKRMVLLR